MAILPRIGMWTGRISFDRTIAFLQGFEAAQDVSIRAMMNGRCEERLGRRTSLTGEAYVKADALGVGLGVPFRPFERS